MSHLTTPAAIRFDSTVETIDAAMIVRLPDPASRRLPSRGQVAVHGSVNGHDFGTVVEPDGAKGHWMRVDPELRESADLDPGDSVSVSFEITKNWPEPTVPPDLAAALKGAPSEIRDIWNDITPMARWEWVRWVKAAANRSTRQRRVDVTISKIDNGKRRPCCFDLSACTDPDVARNGKLRDST